MADENTAPERGGKKEIIPFGQTFHRQLDIVSPEELKTPVTVIGAGGIGSLTVLNLAKLGVPNITVFDHDKIEEHNLPNQFYRPDDIGKQKVQALREIVKTMTGTEITACDEWYTNQRLSGIVIAALDSMKTRRVVWQNCKLRPRVKLFVDARMGGLSGQIIPVFPMDADDIARYESPVISYPDENVVEEPCTARAVMFNVFIIGGFIAQEVARFAKGKPLPAEILIDLETSAVTSFGR